LKKHNNISKEIKNIVESNKENDTETEKMLKKLSKDLDKVKDDLKKTTTTAKKFADATDIIFGVLEEMTE
jgi:hypothetical protein